MCPQAKDKCRCALVVVLVIMLLELVAIVVMAVFLARSSQASGSERADELSTKHTSFCLTTECTSAAARLSQSLDTSVLPCDDFYQFSCGNWMKTNDIPPAKAKVTAIGALQDRLLMSLQKLLEADIEPTDRSFANKAKTFYNSCVRRDTEVKGYQRLKVMVESEFGGWPLLADRWNESTFDLADLVAKSNRHRVDAILGFSVIVNVYEPSKNVMKATVPEPYLRYIENTIESWHTRFSNQMFDLLKYFKAVTSDPDIGIDDVTPSEAILTTPGLYLKNILPDLLTTPKRTIANYIIWRVIHSYLGTIPEAVKGGSRIMRDSACLEDIAYFNDLRFAANQMFLREWFHHDDKTEVTKMIQSMKDTFAEMMSEAAWLDNVTLQLSREKIAAMVTKKVGYSEKIFNDSALEIYYSNVTLTPDSYLENTVRLRKDDWGKMLRRLRTPNYVSDLWLFLPIQVNAFYDLPTNSMEYPSSLFQPPYFGRNEPRSLQYGALGAVIGHELTHGFDSSALSGWDVTAVSSFQNKARCLIDQYNGYLASKTNTSINGSNTLNENIADNGGIRNSFRAYKKWEASQKREEPALPGLNYTHDQLYFISYAQVYCELATREALTETTMESLYSPGRYRTIGPVQNMREFAEVFHGPADTYMNPGNRCALW